MHRLVRIVPVRYAHAPSERRRKKPGPRARTPLQRHVTAAVVSRRTAKGGR